MFCLCGYPSSRSSRARSLVSCLLGMVVVVEVQSSCSQLPHGRRCDDSELLQIPRVPRVIIKKLSPSLFLPFLGSHSEKSGSVQTTPVSIDRLSRPSLNSFFLEVRQCCGLSCVAGLKRSSYTLVTSFCYSIALRSASLHEARL